jgi:hypothetical protein
MNHWPTNVGNAGCMIATPTPITTVMEKSIGTEGPRPRSAELAATISVPAIAARRAPRRAIKREPGTAAIPNSSTGRPVSAATIFSLRCRS